MPLISCSFNDISNVEDNLKPCRRQDVFGKKRCPVCWNSSPRFLLIDSCGDIVGCDACLEIEYCEEP